jgi:hypothetical protein
MAHGEKAVSYRSFRKGVQRPPRLFVSNKQSIVPKEGDNGSASAAS